MNKMFGLKNKKIFPIRWNAKRKKFDSYIHNLVVLASLTDLLLHQNQSKGTARSPGNLKIPTYRSRRVASENIKHFLRTEIKF